MNNFNMNDSRNRRNLLNWSGFFPFHSVTNYSSNSSKIKIDMKNSFGDALFINNLHLIPDPLKKNLADSIITEVTTKANMASETHSESKLKENNSADYHTDSYLPLGFITSFISGVFSFVSGGMFHKRTNSPTQYYECYEKNFDESMPSLQAWHSAKPEDQNKNGWAHNFIHSTNESSKTTDELNINTNSKSAFLCDNNLNQVCLLLSNNSPTQYQSRQESGQQNIFVDSNSIEDCFEDAFTSEDFESLPDDDSCLELYKSFSHVKPELLVSDAPRIRSEHVSLSESIEIVNSLSDITNKEPNVSAPDKDDLDKNVYSKANIVVSSCEDKMNKLKALLQKCQKDKTNADNYTTNIVEKPLKQKELKTEPIFIPNTIDLNSTVENIFKEYTRKKAISPTELYSEDIIKDINKDVQTSLTDSQCSNTTSEYLSPCNYFDEVTGRFYSTSADSEDSFQIVFDDSPKSCRGRISSECESEDSFIIFDDTPDSCYSSNDIFGDELNITGYDFIESSDSESSDDSDSDSDSESDSGCDTYNFTCKLSHSLTRTIGDLTDDSLYNMDKDEVDCAARFVEEKPVEVISDLINVDNTSETKTKPRGLLLDDKRKLEKKKQPSKTVRFSSNPPKVHVMRVWAFAARQARAGHWERHALDRERFKRRIADVDMAVSWVLKPQHRARVMFQRFMPWWNAQRRMELAEKKQREEEEKSTEVEEISPDLPEVTKSDSGVDNTNVGNNLNQETYKNQENADISKKSHPCDVKDNLTSNGKILLDNSKTNGLKHGFQNNNVGVST